MRGWLPGVGMGMAGDPWLSAELAGYRIEAVIGRGGMGVVYRATHLRLDRPVALKLLAAGLGADAQYRQRFEREARLAASLDHPHIVPIYDAGYAQGVLYLAMRYINGPNLATVIDTQAPMTIDRVCALLTGIADTLDTAHHAGLVHRDVKPANILLATPDRPGQPRWAYLGDFGIARHTAATSVLTSTGQLLGTLHYCAPEQIQGQPVDGRADQYALACVVFHCLTGQVPFPTDEPSAVMYAHLHTNPPKASAHHPGLPAAVDDILAQALAKQPTHRFSDCTTFLQALQTANNPATPTQITPPAPQTPHPTKRYPTQDHSTTDEHATPTNLGDSRDVDFVLIIGLVLAILAAGIAGVIALIYSY